MKVCFKLFEAVSLRVNLEVNSFKPSVNAYNRSAVIGGNISLNASFIGSSTLRRPSSEFHKESIKFCLPDGFAIFFANSSSEMLPSLTADSRASISAICSFV